MNDQIIIDTGSSSSSKYRARRKRQQGTWRVWFGVTALLLAVVGGVIYFQLIGSHELMISAIDPLRVSEQQQIGFKVPVAANAVPADTLRFSLRGAPQGASVDPFSGYFQWEPNEAQGPGEYEVVLHVKARGYGIQSQRSVHIHVLEHNTLPKLEPIANHKTRVGESVTIQLLAHDDDIPAQSLRYELIAGEEVGAHIDQNSGSFEWQPSSDYAGQAFGFAVCSADDAGRGPAVRFKIDVLPASRPSVEVATSNRPERPAVGEMERPQDPSPDTADTAAVEAPEPFVAAILELYENNTLLNQKFYAQLRKASAEAFAHEHAAEINTAFGEPDSELRQWLDKRPELKEELYLAIRPGMDRVDEALSLFAQLYETHGAILDRYAQLAIATVVVWDQPGAVIDQRGRVSWTKTNLPENPLGAIENFAYLVDAERYMQGRIEYLPWEVLVYVVNHRTPLDERKWALQKYLDHRVMFGKCYHDVPYDFDALDSKFEVWRIAGQDYTLPNIQTYGGVCDNQADYASRVGKSLGVPAVYVAGASRYGEGHAWVMWVELQRADASRVTFRLESHGRYRGDHFYVGDLRDPQSGKKMTDRQLEMRLNNVGIGIQQKRQADLVMRAYPLLLEYAQLDTADELRLLYQVVELSPGTELVWRQLASLVRENHKDKQYSKRFAVVLEALFDTFAAYPDFTWEVFEDLVSYRGEIPDRISAYQRLIQIYEQAGRPDLASEAVIRLSELFVEMGELPAAIDALATSIRLHPAEGTYVPGMMDRLEKISADVDEKAEKLTQFYLQILPQIPKKRLGRPSEYCISMHERALAVFEKSGRAQLATACRAELNNLKSTDTSAG